MIKLLCSMTAEAGLSPILFVGAARICRQVAYVLDIKDYAMLEKLTAENYVSYRDSQIYVCAFKRRSRKLVARNVLKTVQMCKGRGCIHYLDDVCQTIDKVCMEEDARRHAQAVPSAANVKAHTEEPQQKRPSRWRHVRRMMSLLPRLFNRTERRKLYIILYVKFVAKYDQYQIMQNRHLLPSLLFLYVLSAPMNPKIQCTFLENNLYIDDHYRVKPCCYLMPVPFGNLLCDGELDELYQSMRARIIKLSSLNRSYCLCDKNCTNGEGIPSGEFSTPAVPQAITVAYDRTCNLCCQSCRNQPYVMDDATKQQVKIITDKITRSGYLDQTPTLVTAGMGEVFYSPSYRQLLTTNLHREKINILSNGTLFNADNWRLIKDKYRIINVEISVDAATPETYQKLRRSNFAHLMQNLRMLSDLRRQGQIHSLGLNFVVQRDNFREMPAFVELGRALGVDRVQFQRMQKFEEIATREYTEKCLIVKNRFLDRELWQVLQDPIFQDPIVDLHTLQPFIAASAVRYR